MNNYGNILYQELHDDILDRLDNYASVSGEPGEFVRQKKGSDVVIANAASYAMMEMVRKLPHPSIPHLIKTVDLVQETKWGNLYSWQFPQEAVTEREDMGIVTFLVNGEQVSWENNQPYESLVHASKSSFYIGNENNFHASIDKKRLYTICDEIKAIIVKKPHSVFAPASNMFAGALVAVTSVTGSAGTVTLNDGRGNSVDVDITAGDAIAVLIGKIIDGVNAATTFSYNAVAADNDSIQFYHRHSIEADVVLNLTVSADGTATYTVTDTGTYELPIPYHYFNDLSLLSFNNLVGTQPKEKPQSPDEDE